MGYEEKKAELGLAYGILDSPTWAGALFYGVQVCSAFHKACNVAWLYVKMSEFFLNIQDFLFCE